MKLNKMSITTVFIMTALSLCILPAIVNADSYKCKVCTITRLGMRPGAFGTEDGFQVQVEDAAGEWTGPRTFYLSDALGKAGWATVLGKTLWLRVVDTTPGSLIDIVQIND